ncbi:GNAT family N-acetyltransferase [Janibacter melonis]|uniref:GNAT family N-acetyltransferase n=1 Tax=Janibacter TaxID=53457 RepID=UPI002042E21F|nr:GNAT family N-acetyltransferase [Janibacter melonis]MCM3555178.1 GNAT family N-acetyltransferase [Janibacter melonis]
MAIRTRLPDAAPGGPTLTDTVGEVVSVDDHEVVVRTRQGEATLPRELVVAARVIPPRPSRRGAPHRAIAIEDLHLVMTKGNPGLETEWLGEPGRGWLLRAGGGYTGRANSALPLGDPGTTDESAVATVVRWYRDRGLTPLLQVPLPPRADWSDDPFAAGLLGQGWRLLTPTLVMTGRGEGLRDALPTGAAADVTIEESPALADEWLEVANPRALARPEATRAVLSAPREQVFLLARDEGGEALGVARVALDAGWAGLYGVHVVPGHRRRGIGAALTAAAGRIALERGVVLSYLQVEEPNTGAVALYERAGLTTHHRYAYLRLDR